MSVELVKLHLSSSMRLQSGRVLKGAVPCARVSFAVPAPRTEHYVEGFTFDSERSKVLALGI